MSLQGTPSTPGVGLDPLGDLRYLIYIIQNNIKSCILSWLVHSDHTFCSFDMMIVFVETSNTLCVRGPGGSMSQVVGSNNSYKPITNTTLVRARICKLQNRVHSTRSRKFSSFLPMVGGSLRVLRLPPPRKLVAMIQLKYC